MGVNFTVYYFHTFNFCGFSQPRQFITVKNLHIHDWHTMKYKLAINFDRKIENKKPSNLVNFQRIPSHMYESYLPLYTRITE